jgi:hypothetical protein
MSNIRWGAAGLLSISVVLGGCATRTPALYQWEGYQSNVDAYFRADKLSLDAQSQLMEEDLQKIRADGGAVPPGYYAHLGLLYGQQGKIDQFAQQMLAEKQQYPESATFVDFLLRNFKK